MKKDSHALRVPLARRAFFFHRRQSGYLGCWIVLRLCESRSNRLRGGPALKRSPVYLRGVCGAVATLALLLTGCGDVTEPRVPSGSGAPTPTFSHIAYGNGFFDYPSGALLHDQGWTRIQRWWPWDVPPILGDWRIRDSVSGSLGGRAVQLENPPVDVYEVRAIRWDDLSATLGPTSTTPLPAYGTAPRRMDSRTRGSGFGSSTRSRATMGRFAFGRGRVRGRTSHLNGIRR